MTMQKSYSGYNRAYQTGCRVFIMMLGLLVFSFSVFARHAKEGLRIATFDVDVTPSDDLLAYDKQVNTWDLSLRAKGIVILGSDDPIVLCSVDWLAISNGGMDQFREAMARAAGTKPERVSLHVVHQHDAPRYDPSAEDVLLKAGIDPAAINLTSLDGTFPRSVIPRLAQSIAAAVSHAKPVTHLGLGKAEIKEVASNRHIYGEDGKVKTTRMSSTKDAAIRAEPEGLIDPILSLVSFWNNETPVAVLTFYACHPQSYYRTGISNPDFPGIARFFRQLNEPDALHIHFNGAGGNIAAGKYNDGSHKNRLILAERMADGMKQAWETTTKTPLQADDLDWFVEKIHLPPAPALYQVREDLKKSVDLFRQNNSSAGKMAWLERTEKKIPVEIACLKLKNDARVIFTFGELFVEYQLYAKQQQKDQFVAMAAYGDLGMGYIGVASSYEKGGYEVGHLISGVDGRAEPIIKKAIRTLLNR